MSSRKFLLLTDGLPAESWFRQVWERDYKEFKAEQENEKTRAARVKKLSPMYAKVPKHLWPKDLREAVTT